MGELITPQKAHLCELVSEFTHTRINSRFLPVDLVKYEESLKADQPYEGKMDWFYQQEDGNHKMICVRVILPPQIDYDQAIKYPAGTYLYVDKYVNYYLDTYSVFGDNTMLVHGYDVIASANSNVIMPNIVQVQDPEKLKLIKKHKKHIDAYSEIADKYVQFNNGETLDSAIEQNYNG